MEPDQAHSPITGAEISGPPVQPPLSRIFTAFLRLGLTAFGGPAMVAYIKDLAVTRQGWLDAKSFGRGVALCQTIPGATAMQTAAYVGLRLRGLSGGVAAYLGFGLPAFVLMVGFSVAYQRAHNLPAAASLFHGLRAIVVALVANATLNFSRSSVKRTRDAVVAGLATVGLVHQTSPMLVILASAALGCWLLREETANQPEEALESPELFRQLLWLLAAGALGLGALYTLDRQLFALAITMLRVDLFAFGGGFGSVPLMQHDVVNVRHWMDAHTFMDGIALGQVTPGPIVITATFVGYGLRGLAGAAVATVSIFYPSLVLLTLVLPVFDRLQGNRAFRSAMRGALLAFVGLLLAVTIHFALTLPWNLPATFLALAALLALQLKVDTLWVVLVGAVLSLLVL